MKKLQKSLFFLVASLFLLGACEQIEMEKLVYDTVYVDRPIRSLVTTSKTDTVVIRDTVTVTVVQHDTLINNVYHTDTLIQVVTKDSLIIKEVTKTVTEYDTITIVNNVVDTVILRDTVEIVKIQQRVVYLAVEYVFPGRSIFYIPDDLLPIYNQFVADATSRGKNLPGGNVIVQYVTDDELIGDGWSSYGAEMSGFQYVIYLSETLTQDLAYSAMYRELTRWQLKKKYSNDINRIICPLFDPERLKYSDSDAKKLPYLNQLFQ